jgi:mRNA-degrading endonuclease RelE of RelBE toxin-antitoxin system
MYSVSFKPDLWKEFLRLNRKDPKQFRILMKKVDEILKDPHRFKNLRAPLNDWKRVRIQNKFILTYSVDEESRVVTLELYEHRDRVYER